jgi:hypothetical protein
MIKRNKGKRKQTKKLRDLGRGNTTRIKVGTTKNEVDIIMYNATLLFFAE